MRWRLKGTGWHLAPGLVTLAVQVNAAYPDRHAADGTLGNKTHRASASDHNPDSDGTVRALDIGEVVEDDAMTVAEAIRESKDIRVKYVIHEARMYSFYWKDGYPPFTWRPYKGANLHWNHVHISTRPSYDTHRADWAIGQKGGDELAYLSKQQQAELAEFLKNLEGIGSNVGFVNFLIPWYRKWRTFLPSNFLKRGDRVRLS